MSSMSTRDNTFFGVNPFKNWPFAASPSRVELAGEPRTCDCDVIDGKHFPSDGGSCPAGMLRQYIPAVLDPMSYPAPQPLGTNNSLRQMEQKPAEKKTAIDSLKAVKSQRIARPQQTQQQQNPPGKENVAPEAPQVENNGNQLKAGTTMDAPSNGLGPAQLDSRMQRLSIQESSSGQNLQSLAREASRYNNSAEPMSQYQAAPATRLASLSQNVAPYREPSTPPAKAPAPFLPTAHGKMVLGCSQCLFDPRLKVISCGCPICLDCGGRFWGSSSIGGQVFCGCGDRVTGVQAIRTTNRAPPGLAMPSLGLPPGIYPQVPVFNPPNFSPTSPAAPVARTGHQFPSPISTEAATSPWKQDHHPAIAKQPAMQLPLHSSAQLPGMSPLLNMQASMPANIPTNIANMANMSRILMMDAETAIQNAPFVELGRSALAQDWSCIKIGNIPYNVTSEELLEFLGKNADIVPEKAGSIGVHVIMDRSTGKTMDAYAEFLSSSDARKCLSRRRSRVLGNRHLTMEIVDASELMKDIFPRAKGVSWESVSPKVVEREDDTKIEIISREELVLIVNHARTPHRSPFSRKCLQRPFQSLMSIVSKFPWFAISIYTIQQRDYIFHALLTAVDILKRQIKRGGNMPNLDIDLLKALLRVGLRCAGFTDAQKYELVKTAEFGAEGIQVDADIGILSGFEALGKAIGAERKVLEFYALLLELSVSPFLSEPSTQGNAAAELIRAKQITKQQPEESKKSHLTMAEAAALEWATIEKAVRTVLPAKLPYMKNIGGNDPARPNNTGVWNGQQ